MNASALTMLLVSEITIAAFTIYFFYKVLTVPPKNEPDSFTDND
jgi:hypothetical protein